MALRNAFENLATESTASDSYLEQTTTDKELFQKILLELRILNLHMAQITGQEISEKDLDMETKI